MSLDVETVLERRRLRRQVGVWRGLAILAGVIVLAAYGFMNARTTGVIGASQIARVTVSGVITDDRKRLKLLERIANASNVRGVILFVDSPGGTTTGGEGLFLALRELAAKKPLAAQFGTVAASAAYIAGLGTDHIVARENSITGSVGVIFQWPEVSQLLENVGVKVNQIKSGTLKAEPSPFEPTNPEALSVVREMVEESQSWFVGLVEQRRNIRALDVAGLTQGRVFSGRMAKQLGLIDAIGGEEEAVAWMVRERNVPEGLKVVDWKPEEPFSLSFAQNTRGWLAWILGSDHPWVTAATKLDALALDGLLSVWQPAEK
ncbi:MAG: signal peptide peptidase SppA [Hyphomicrobiaceae bacterium]